MALEIQDHIHLDVSNPPTAEYDAQQGTLDHTYETAVTFERSVLGKLHVHRIIDGIDPVQFEADSMTLICTLAQMNTLRALAGKRVYYVPNYHDDAALGTYPTSSYIIRGLLIINRGGITNLDPPGTYWTVQISVVDDTQVT